MLNGQSNVTQKSVVSTNRRKSTLKGIELIKQIQNFQKV